MAPKNQIVRSESKPSEIEIDQNVPLEYLLSISDEGLQSFELARLAHAANLDKDIAMIQRERDEEKLAADVARWLRKHRSEILESIRAGFRRVGIDEGQERFRPKLPEASKELPPANSLSPAPTTQELAQQLAELEQQLKRIMETEAEITMGGAA